MQSEEAALLREQIEQARAASSYVDPALAAPLAALRRWQAARLARTYDDFLRDRRYRLAAKFFLDDLYGTVEPSHRDDDIERIYPLAIKVLSPETIRSWALAMELDAISRKLDLQLVEMMVRQLGMTDTVTEQSYAEGYRRCDNYEERRHQIELIARIGEILDEVVRRPMLYTTLRLARTPAKLAGFGVLQDFLERGFDAFRKMGGAEHFLGTIVARETRILDRIYAGDPDPFRIDAPEADTTVAAVRKGGLFGR